MDAHYIQELRQELLETKLALEANQKYTESLISAIPDIVTLTDLQGTILFTSQTANSTFGYPLDTEFTGKNLTEFIHPDEVPKAISRISDMFTGKMWGAESYKGLKADGTTVDIEVNGQFIRNSEGEPEKIVFITRDISNKRKTEMQLHESETSYLQLFENMEQGVVYQNPEGYIINANPAAQRILGLSLDQLQGRNSTHPDWKAVRFDLSPFPGDEHPAMVALKTGKKVVNVEMGVYHPETQKYEWILVSAEPEFREGESKPWRVFATFTDISLQKKAEFNLAEKTRQTEVLMDNLTGIVFRCKIDEKWTMEYMSSYVQQICGYLPDDFISNKNIEFSAIIHPDDKKRVLSTIKNNVKTKTRYSIEYRIIAKSGEIKWVWEIGQAVYNQDDAIALEGFISDITEKKLNEEALIEKERMLQNILNTQTNYYLKTDLQGKIIYWNKKWETDFSYLFKDKMMHADVLTTIVENYHENCIAIVSQCIQNPGKIYSIELDKKLKDRTISTLWEFVCLVDAQNQPAEIQCMGLDVSNRKQAERKLVQSEARYRSFFEENQSIILVSNILTDEIVDANSAAAEFYGWSPDELCSMKLNQINILSEEEIAKENELAEKENRKHLLYRHKLSNGEIRDVEVYSSKLIYKDASVKLSIIHDISNRIHAEEEIRKLSRAVHQSPVSIVITNLNGNIEYANPKACETTGYSFEELKGNNPRVLKSGETDDNEYKSLWEKISSGKEWTGIFHNKRKNGELYWESSSISPIINTKGEITHFLAVKLDISKEILAQEELKKFRTISDEANYGAIILSLDGELVYQNEAFAKMHGFESSELLNHNIRILDVNDKEGSLSSFILKIPELISLSNVEIKTRTRSGSELPCLMNIQLIADDKGKPRFIAATLVDNSRQKEYEAEIINQNARFNAIIQAMPDLIFIVDSNGTIIDNLNPHLLNLEFPNTSIIGQNIQIFHSGNDPAQLLQKVNECLSTKKLITDENQSIINGKVYFFETRMAYLGPNRVLRLVSDISLRKNQENEIRKLNFAIEQSPVSILITDLEGKITYVSSAFEKSTGYSASEVVGKNTNILKSGITPEKVYKELWETITSGKIWNGEWQNRRKDGSLYWEKISISPIFDYQGRIFNFLSIKEDISSQKLQEEEILRLNSTLEERIVQRTAELKEANQLLVSEIKEREQIEAELLVKTKELETFFAVTLDMLVISDFKWNCIKINNAVINILGYSENELMQNTFIHLVHPEDIEPTVEAMSDLQKGKTVAGFVNRYKTKTGEYRFIEWNAYPMNNLVYAAARDITQKMESEHLLNQTRINYETFFNTIDDFLWVLDNHGNILHTNQTVTNRLGYPPNELLNQSVLLVHPEERREEAARIVGEMLAGTAAFCPIPVITHSGKLLPVETRVKSGFWNGQPVIFGVSKDISAIQLSEQKFSSAFQVNSALMAISEYSTGVFIDVNHSFLEILGFNRSEIIGKTNTECDLLQNPENLAEMIQRLEKGNEIKKEEILMKTKGGEQKTGLLSADFIYIGDMKCLLTVTVDITERKKAEEDLHKARKEADKANQAKSEFLSRMSHELRTPLNSILGFAQLLELADIPLTHKKEIRHIMKSGWHLLDLINEVLDISRIEAGKMSLSIEPVKLDLIISEMIDFVKTQAAGRFITVNLQDSPYNSLNVLSDRQRLKQVLLNLINNGIKYNKEGGFVKIKVQPGKRPSSQLPILRISIEDSGYGISENAIGKLFQPFERVGAEKSSVEGTGLGLTVVKKIIENMNGEVGVESKYGKGSTFWFELPMAEDQLDTIRKLEEERIEKSKTEVRAGKILYIEDNIYNVELIEQILDMQRPEVKMISNSFGRQALGLAIQNQPDLILLDLDLPDIHGSEVYEQLKADPLTAKIPVVVISSDALAQQINKMLSAGVKHYLTKPIKITEFLDILDEYINS